MKLLKEAASAVFTDDTVGAAFDRYKERNEELRVIFQDMWKDAEEAPRKIEVAAKKAEAATSFLGASARKAIEEQKKATTEQVKNLEALSVARSADAQVALSGLQTQLELARQSEAMAQLLGKETDVRKARIAQMEIEIQISRAKVEVARVEAEGSIAVAEAKLAELRIAGELTPLKEAELQATIKLAQAKLNEAQAAGQSAALLEKQLELFRRAKGSSDGFGSNLDRLTRSQRGFAGATHEANEALQRQNELQRTRFSRPGEGSNQQGNESNYDPGRNMYGRAGRDDQPRNGDGQTQAEFQRGERLAGQNAVDNTLIFALRDKLNAGVLTAEDARDLSNAIAALDQNEQVNRDLDRMNPSAFSLEGAADRNEWRNVRQQFEQALARVQGAAGLPQRGAASVGKTVRFEINMNGRNYGPTETDEPGAANMERFLRDLERDKRRSA